MLYDFLNINVVRDKMDMDISSLAEIGVLGAAYEQGATSLGTAKSALKARWSANLRDNETLIRLLFLSWYPCSEPGNLTGLRQYEKNEFENLLSDAGGPSSLEAESQFILGVLSDSDSFPFCCGAEDKWSKLSGDLFKAAVEQAPHSLVFRNWEYLMNKREEPTDPRIHIRPELYARFHGRGTWVHICYKYRVSALGSNNEVKPAPFGRCDLASRSAPYLNRYVSLGTMCND